MRRAVRSNDRVRLLILASILGAVLAGALTLPLLFNPTKYYSTTTERATATGKQKIKAKSQVTHMATPTAVRAVYMSQCGATSAKIRTHIQNLIKDTELNAVVIDVKDYTGTVSFKTKSDVILAGGKGCVVHDMKELLKELHDNEIYTIARITVFQDPLYARKYPERAVHRKSATTTPWEDYKGLEFIDVGAREFWKYIVTISREAHAIGFDEINFDYIRYPSDGNMRDVYYTHSGDDNGIVANRAEELEKFFRYLSLRLRRDDSDGHTPVLSADLFGMTTTNFDDLTIGQVQEVAEPYFDYIAPMVYPSHYPNRFLGLDNPNNNVYKVVNYSIRKAVERMVSTTSKVASTKHNERLGTSTPAIYKKPASDKNKLRPWLQDFNYGGIYGATEVRAQIQATYDAGISSWMLWDPANRYTREALKTSQ